MYIRHVLCLFSRFSYIVIANLSFINITASSRFTYGQGVTSVTCTRSAGHVAAGVTTGCDRKSRSHERSKSAICMASRLHASMRGPSRVANSKSRGSRWDRRCKEHKPAMRFHRVITCRNATCKAALRSPISWKRKRKTKTEAQFTDGRRRSTREKRNKTRKGGGRDREITATNHRLPM